MILNVKTKGKKVGTGVWCLGHQDCRICRQASPSIPTHGASGAFSPNMPSHEGTPQYFSTAHGPMGGGHIILTEGYVLGFVLGFFCTQALLSCHVTCLLGNPKPKKEALRISCPASLELPGSLRQTPPHFLNSASGTHPKST